MCLINTPPLPSTRSFGSCISRVPPYRWGTRWFFGPVPGFQHKPFLHRAERACKLSATAPFDRDVTVCSAKVYHIWDLHWGCCGSPHCFCHPEGFGLAAGERELRTRESMRGSPALVRAVHQARSGTSEPFPRSRLAGETQLQPTDEHKLCLTHGEC